MPFSDNLTAQSLDDLAFEHRHPTGKHYANRVKTVYLQEAVRE